MKAKKIVRIIDQTGEHQPEINYNVQVLTSIDGGKSYHYSGEGRFCQTLEQAAEWKQRLESEC